MATLKLAYFDYLVYYVDDLVYYVVKAALWICQDMPARTTDHHSGALALRTAANQTRQGDKHG